MIYRIINEAISSTKKSILLLGPRQTGKSTLISSLPHDLKINFANESVYIEHASNPDLILDLIERKKAKTVFVDEVQRLPSILNTIQSIIDEKKVKFNLTGSSARKLKRGGANLLPGRVVNFLMGPITFKELGYKVDIQQALRFGFLPEIFNNNSDLEKKRLLESYSANYLKEEIKAEALTKSLESFARFMNELVDWNAQFIDYTKISKRSKISRHTCPNYFEILEETMIGQRVFPDTKLMEEFDLTKHPKFYFFDVGVFNGLAKDFEISGARKGFLVEQLVYQQLFHTANALEKDIKINTFRTRGGLEIDFAVTLEKKLLGIEVKSTDNLIDDDVSPLLSLKKQIPTMTPLVWHAGKKEFRINGIWALPIAVGLKEIGL